MTEIMPVPRNLNFTVLPAESFGPLGFIKENKIRKAPGNAEQYHLENVKPLADSPLAGKQLLFLGSSVTAGDASLGVSMADYIAKLDGCTVIKEAVSGTTLAGTGKSTYTSRLLQADTGLPLDARGSLSFFVQLFYIRGFPPIIKASPVIAATALRPAVVLRRFGRDDPRGAAGRAPKKESDRDHLLLILKHDEYTLGKMRKRFRKQE